MASLKKKRKQARLKELRKCYEAGGMTELEWLAKANEILHPGRGKKLPDRYRIIVKMPPGLLRTEVLCKACGFRSETTKKIAKVMRSHRKVCLSAVFATRTIFGKAAVANGSRLGKGFYKKSKSKGPRTKNDIGLNCPEVYPDDN
jgi:hypothetical protein